MQFELNKKLEQDTIHIAELKLSRLLLMNDQRFPWLILVPRVVAATEIHELSTVDQTMLTQEYCMLARILKTICAADKINIASLENIVPQLHVHIIARSKNDAAWPKPVWGFGHPIAYDITVAQQFISAVVKLLS